MAAPLAQDGALNQGSAGLNRRLGPVLSAMGKFLSLARLAPIFLRQPVSTYKRHLWRPIRVRIGRFGRSAYAALLSLADGLFGTAFGNRIFWLAPARLNAWHHIETRLFVLASRPPEFIDHFVDRALEHCRGCIPLMNMARSEISKGALARALESVDLGEGTEIHRRIGNSVQFSAGLVAAASYLLDANAFERILVAVQSLRHVMPASYAKLIDSFCTVPTQRPQNEIERNIPASGFKTAKKHRLIISAHLASRAGLSLLFGGTENVTLFAPENLYGKESSVSDELHAHPVNVFIEHPRSRITRFSAEYYQLHAETRDAARSIIDDMAAMGDGVAPFPAEARLYTELALADSLFFSALKLAAARKLIASPEFDHIVIATDEHPANAAFLQFLSCLPEIGTDPRIEIISTSNSATFRVRSAAGLETMFEKADMPAMARARVLPWAEVSANLRAETEKLAGRLKVFPDADGPKALMVTTPERPYNSSSIAFISALQSRYNLLTAFLGNNALAFLRSAQSDIDGVAADNFVTLRETPAAAFPELNLAVDLLLADAAARFGTGKIAAILTSRRAFPISANLVSYLVFLNTAKQWFKQMREAGSLPDLAVLSPVRNVRVASFIALARRYDVPTLALEPHGLNANYCRYTTVSADYYGVISAFFKEEAVSGFEVPADRCVVIGSPRLIAPVDYDKNLRTDVVRRRLQTEQGIGFEEFSATISFLTQPINLDHMLQSWRMILGATAGKNIQILLKTHPEENAHRASAYLEAARELGAQDRVLLIEGPASDTIEASDIVLSAYSATVLEATLLRRPVICVTNGPVDYPLDQHRVVEAPLYRNESDLGDGIDAILAAPAETARRIDSFLHKERQFLDGPTDRLYATIDEILALPPGQALRDSKSLPGSCFLSRPHQAFDI